MNKAFLYVSDTSSLKEFETVRDIGADKIEKEASIADKQTLSAADYSRTVDDLLKGKQYQHWESDSAREINRQQIENYDEKKRAVDRSSLETQSSILKEHGERFTRENLDRNQSEIGSNKIEIYNERTFATEKDPSFGSYNILGLRDIPDGKICIRDNDDLDTLRHVSTHETMHDLSYQATDSLVKSEFDPSGRAVTTTDTTMISGIHLIEKKERMVDGVSDLPDIKQYNRYLNEGYTELYTIEEMQKRGEFPSFDSYTDEVGWALALREKLGADAVADAYFGGDLTTLEEHVNGMSAVPDAWKELNKNIDAYHYTRDVRYKKAADDIIDNLQEPKILGKRLVRR